MVRRRILALFVAMLVFDVVAVLVFTLGTPTKTADAAVETLFWKGVYRVDQAVRSNRNLSAIHAKPEANSSAECVACHGSMKTPLPAAASSSQDTLGPRLALSSADATASRTASASLGASASITTSAGAETTASTPASSSVNVDVHFHMSLEVTNFSCTDCHRTNRVWNVARTGLGSNATTGTAMMLRTNRFFCFKCHGSFDAYVKRGRMRAEWKDQDCTMCHKGKLAPRHEQPFLSQVLSPRECLMCHGDNLFPWPTQHYGNQWATAHGPFAQDVNSCAVCHATGPICGDCHKIKPSTHSSAWRGRHQAAYRARPSRCAVCHTSKSCNDTCHLVNHTKAFRDAHGSTVLDKGPDYCMNCHYLGYCINCHDTSKRRVRTIDFGSTIPTSAGRK